jgi:hypothetical protein
VHWIYRKALHRGDLRNHKGRDIACLKGKECGQSNSSVWGSCGESRQTLYKSRLSSYSGTPKYRSMSTMYRDRP